MDLPRARAGICALFLLFTSSSSFLSLSQRLQPFPFPSLLHRKSLLSRHPLSLFPLPLLSLCVCVCIPTKQKSGFWSALVFNISWLIKDTPGLGSPFAKHVDVIIVRHVFARSFNESGRRGPNQFALRASAFCFLCVYVCGGENTSTLYSRSLREIMRCGWDLERVRVDRWMGACDCSSLEVIAHQE